MPYLVTVEGQRIPLRRGQAYTLGRGRKCDVLLEDRACSRSHARLTVDRGGRALMLEDLHSRNGTFLDGDLVLGPREVPEGGRIRVGTTIFLAHVKEADDEERFAETGTMGFDDLPQPDLEAGELERTGLIEVLTRLLIDRRDVTLRIALADGEARIEVRNGEVQAAEYGGHTGFNALVRVGRRATGIFWLSENKTPIERNIGERPDRLLSLLARCLDPAPSR
ncbi:MAG TPA: FHA domain-containing protein [Planctomycetota bacterium]|nr:FHA domain-containing protein [Planctomycetota bacterium]